MGWKIVTRKAPVVETEREPRERKPRENIAPVVSLAWASSEQRVVYLLLNTVVVRELGLVPGDTLDLFTDRGRIAVVKARKDKGEFKVYAHGANASRLKLTVTNYYKRTLAHKGDMVGQKFVARIEEGFQVPPDENGKERKPGKAVVFSPRPRKEEPVETPKRGRPRKVEAVEPARKRGRPRKVEVMETPAPKRGRPRKVKGEPMALAAPEPATT